MRKIQYFNNVIYKHVKSLYSIEKYLKIDYAFKNKKYVLLLIIIIITMLNNKYIML